MGHLDGIGNLGKAATYDAFSPEWRGRGKRRAAAWHPHDSLSIMNAHERSKTDAISLSLPTVDTYDAFTLPLLRLYSYVVYLETGQVTWQKETFSMAHSRAGGQFPFALPTIHCLSWHHDIHL